MPRTSDKRSFGNIRQLPSKRLQSASPRPTAATSPPHEPSPAKSTPKPTWPTGAAVDATGVERRRAVTKPKHTTFAGYAAAVARRPPRQRPPDQGPHPRALPRDPRPRATAGVRRPPAVRDHPGTRARLVRRRTDRPPDDEVGHLQPASKPSSPERWPMSWIDANPCRIRGAGSAKRARTTSARPVSSRSRRSPPRCPTGWRSRSPARQLASRAAGRDPRATLRRRRPRRRGDPHPTRPGARRRPPAGRHPEIVGRGARRRDPAAPPPPVPRPSRVRPPGGPGDTALLFPSAADPTRYLQVKALYKDFHRARAEIGRQDLRWHDLRHSGAVLAAMSGASLAELMGRLGHSTPGAAMRYQHVAAGRDREIAASMSKLTDTPDGTP